MTVNKTRDNLSLNLRSVKTNSIQLPNTNFR